MNKGDKFRNQVAGLIGTRFTDIREEVHVTGKNADIIFKNTEIPGQNFTYAIECKNYQKPLRSSDIRSIISDYEQAKKQRDIDFLWVVASVDVSAPNTGNN